MANNIDIVLNATLDLKNIQKSLNLLSKNAPNIDIDATLKGNLSTGLDKINKRTMATVTSLHVMREALRLLESAAKNMIDTAVSLDNQLTNLRMTTGANYEEAANLVRSYSDLAKELSATTTQVLEASDQWLRQGHSIADTNELIAQSLILSKVGSMSAAEATKYLTSAMNGYGVEVANVSSIVDALTAVDLKAATSSADLAEAMSRTSKNAEIAGVDMNKLIGYIATVQEVTQRSASSIGTSFNSMFSRMGNIKIGNFLSDDGENLNDAEAVLKSFGIMLRDTEGEFRNFGEVFDEIASKWESFSNVEKRSIAQSSAGMRNYENFLVLMDNYGQAIELAGVAADSAGTSLQRFAAYEDSISARVAQFTAAYEALSFNTIDSGFVKTIIDAGIAIITVIDNLNLLQISLHTLAAAGAVKVFSSLGSSAKELIGEVKQISTAFTMLNSVNSDTGMISDQFDDLVAVTNGLSTSQMRLIVTNKALNTEQRTQLLMSAGLSESQAKQTLATMGLTTATGGAAASTFSLKGALQALGVSLASNPLGLFIVGLTAAVSVISTVINKSSRAQEELRKKAVELGDALKTQVSAIDELRSKINDETLTREGLIDLMEAHNQQYADELSAIEDLNQAREESLRLLDEESRAKAEETVRSTGSQYVEQMAFLENDEYKPLERMSIIGTPEEVLVEIGKRIDEYTAKIDGEGLEWYEKTTLETLENAYAEVSKSVEEAKSVTESYELAQSILNGTYQETIDLANDYAEGISDLSTNTESTISNLESLEQAIQAYKSAQTEAEKEFRASQMQDILSKVKEEAQSLNIEWEEAQNAIDLVSDALEGVSSETSRAVAGISDEIKPALDALATTYSNLFSDGIFSIDNLNTDDLEKVRSALSSMSEMGLKVDYSSYDDFVQTLTDSTSTLEDVQGAFNDLASSVIENLGGVTEENYNVVEAMLESLGVADAQMAAFNALLNSTEALTNMTYQEAQAFVAEHVSANYAGEALALLQLKKLLVNGVVINTAADIQNIYNLASAAGMGVELLGKLTEAKALFESGSVGDIAQAQALYTEAQREMSAWTPGELDFSQITASASKAGGDAGDAYLEAFEDEFKQLKELFDDGLITENQYLERLRVLYQRYFKDRKEYVREYAKYERQYLDGMKSMYDKVISHATSIIDDHISDLNKQRDATISSYEEQKKAAEDARQAEIDAIDAEIDGLQKIIDARQAEIDAIKQARAERQADIDLQKAQAEVNRMENQKTVQVFDDGQIRFGANTTGIRDAREELAQAEEEVRINSIEKEISALEKNIDALERQKEAIENMVDATSEYYDRMIEETESYYNSMISGLEESKSRWEELGELTENAEMLTLLKDLGYTEQDILNMSSGAFENFRTTYMAILSDMYSGNQGMLDSLGQLSGLDMSTVPSFLKETEEYFNKIANMDVTALTGNVDTVNTKFGEMADAAGSAASAISGGGGGSKSEGSSEGNNGEESGAGTSLKDSIDQLSTESVEKINQVASAFSGEEQSVTSAIQEVIGKIGSGESESGEGGKGEGEGAGVDTLTGALQAHVEAALDEESGIPAEKTAWEELNEPLAETAEYITTITTLLEDINGKTFEITLNVTGANPTQLSSIFNGSAKAEGTAYFNGTAYAQGNWGARESGRSLVGEIAPEIVVRNGRFFTVGNNGPEMFDIQKGDIVFNHLQTKQLLSSGKTTGRGKAYADGNISNSNSHLVPLEIYDPEKFRYLTEMSEKLRHSTDYTVVAMDRLGKSLNGVSDRLVSNINNSNQYNNRNFNFGDIILNEVNNGNELTKRLNTIFLNALDQEIYRR